MRVDSLARTLERASHGKVGREGRRDQGHSPNSCGIDVATSAFSFPDQAAHRADRLHRGQVSEVEARIREGVEAVEPLVLTIPGIGHTLGAQIVSEIGDVRRFRNASAIVKYAGINPSISQSGEVHLRGEPHHQARVAVPPASPSTCSNVPVAAQDPVLRLLREKARTASRTARPS